MQASYSRLCPCGARIRFQFNEATGRYMPLNEDGTSHFSTCPQAGRFRREKKPKPSDSKETK